MPCSKWPLAVARRGAVMVDPPLVDWCGFEFDALPGARRGLAGAAAAEAWSADVNAWQS